MQNVEGSVALVTGAASGLGSATARALARRGFGVMAIDLPTAIEMVQPAHGVTFVAADVTNEDQVQAALDRAMEMSPVGLCCLILSMPRG